MRKQYKSVLVLAVMAAFIATLLFLPGLIGAGELEPSGPLGPTMKTLQDIYDKLDVIARDSFEIKTHCPSHWRFCDMADGTVLDMETGLIWLKNANCFGNKNWNNAMKDVANLADGQCGLSDGSSAGDWRLPTEEEWKAFVAGVYPNNLYTNPDLCNAAGTGQWSQGDAFTNVQSSKYWSSNEAGCNPNYAWYVNMVDGRMGQRIKDNYYYVWTVRPCKEHRTTGEERDPRA